MEPNHLSGGHNEPDELLAIAKRFPNLDNADLAGIVRFAGPDVLRMLGSRFRGTGVDPEEILAEAVFRLWHYRRGYDPSRGSITAYLYAIARHIAIEHVAQQNKRMQLVESRNSETYDRGHDDSDTAPPSQAQRDIQEILDQWPAIDRNLVLAWAEESGTDWASQFAKRHNRTSTWVRVRRMRLVERLRSEMTKRGHVIKELEP